MAWYHRDYEYVPHHFTSYLLSRGLLDNGEIPRQLLLDYYVQYSILFPSYLGRYEILRALKYARLIFPAKLNRDGSPSNIVRFKNRVFQISRMPEAARPLQRAEDVVRPVRVYTNQRYLFRNKSGRDEGITTYHCGVCKIDMKDSTTYKNHLSSSIHSLRNLYRTNKRSLTALGSYIKVENGTSMTLRLKQEKTLTVKLENKFSEPVTFTRVFSLVQIPSVKLICECPQQVAVGEKFTLNVKASFDSYGAHIEPVIFQIQVPQKEELQNFLVDLTFHVQIEELDDIGPEVPYTPPSKVFVRVEQLPIVRGVSLPRILTGLRMVPLPLYNVPGYAIRIMNHGFKKFDTMKPDDEEKLKYMKSILNDEEGRVCRRLKGLNGSNYVERYRLMLWMEEHQLNQSIHAYDRSQQTLKKVSDVSLSLKVAGLSEGRPSVLRGDSVLVKHSAYDGMLYEGIVHEVQRDTVLLGFSYNFHRSYREGTEVDVQFTFSRVPLRTCYRALEQIENRKLADYHGFPREFGKKAKKSVTLMPWFNKDIKSNQQQMQAVSNIVKGTAYPAPYIIFGPPGTGKTVTIVEAVKQLWSLEKGRICICAPTNSAADVLTKRLLTSVPPDDILRVYAWSHFGIPQELRECSNLTANGIHFPDAEIILNKSIVVTTLITAGRLVSSTVPIHFKYVFIDEAGHAMEPEAMIPIVGLLAKKEGHVILAGDPKQLGPIIRSPLASEFGLDISYLEKLMSQVDLYRKEPDYNPKLITKLQNNYRSHEALLYIPNKLFYDDGLLAKGNKDITHMFSEFGSLQKGFPLLFHGVQGIEEREGDSPSFFNRQEIQCLLNYLDVLIGSAFKGYLIRPEDVGIISPYRKQVQKIRKLFAGKRQWDAIEVGSVEQFQGGEKLVMIISTVRSRHEFLAEDYQFGLGFLRCPKRFNVAITRAKALLIVIGNPDVLQCDPNWRELINYCEQNNSCRGYKSLKPVSADFDPMEKLCLDLSALALSNTGEMNEEERPGYLIDY